MAETVTTWREPTPRPDADGAVVATWSHQSLRVYVRENGAINFRHGGASSWTQYRVGPDEAAALVGFLAALMPAASPAG